MSRFTILLGGELTATPRVAAQVADTRVIAADSGIRHAAALGLVPELWVGDFDSAPDEAFASVERKTFPAAKNQTDGELAVAQAIEREATSLVLAGAFGGPRFDHSFFHAALAVRLMEEGFDVVLTSGNQEGIPLSCGKPQAFDFAADTVFSVLGLSQIEGLTVTGARWPLENVDVPFGSSWTLSNEVRDALGITLRKGRALLLAHPFPATGF